MKSESIPGTLTRKALQGFCLHQQETEGYLAFWNLVRQWIPPMWCVSYLVSTGTLFTLGGRLSSHSLFVDP